MRIQRRLVLTGAAVATASTLLAGCASLGNGTSSTGDESTGRAEGGAGSDQAAAPANQPAAPKIKWTLMTLSTKKLGRIMVNGAGMTLYRFDGDTASPSVSKCLGACAKMWPPVTIHSTNLVLKGFDATLLGRIKRADGTWQLTLHGWPLYTYSGDTKAGVWTGQGLKGKWFVAAVDGSKAIAAKSLASSGSRSSGAKGSAGSAGSGSSGSSGSAGSGGDYGYGGGGGY